MLKRYRSLFSLLLVLCMLMQPFAAPMTVWAEEEAANESTASIEDSETSFDEAYEQVMALKEIELGWFMKQVLNCCSIADNCGEYWDSAVNGTKPEYVDYVAQIKESNAAVKSAQESMEAAKKDRDNKMIGAAAKLDPKEVADKGLTAAAKAEAVNRECLERADKLLVGIGDTLDTIKTAVEIIGPIMKIVAAIPIPAVQEVALGISEVCDAVILALDAAIPMLKGTGQGLLDTAEAGYASDAQLMGNVAMNTAGEAAKVVAEEAISEGCTSLIGDSAKWFADCGFTNPDSMQALSKGFWDTTAIGKNAASDMTFEALSGMNSVLFNEGTKEATKEATEGLIDVGLEAMDMTLPSVKEFAKDKADQAIDWTVDQAEEKVVKPSVGLDFE